MKKSALTLVMAASISFAACGVESGQTDNANAGNDGENNANDMNNDVSDTNDDENNEAETAEVEHEWQLGWNSGLDGDSKGEAAKAFAEYVEAESNGRIEIEFFPNETYATSPEMIDAVQVGALDMALPGANELAGLIPEYAALSLPFLTEGFEEAHAVLDGPVGDDLKALGRDAGFETLNDVEIGFAQITNDVRPIEVPEDIEGLSIRSPNDVSLIETFNALGASVSTMAYTELYSGLSQGVIDGQFNPMLSIYDQNMHEVQDYLAVTNHTYYYSYFIMNADLFDTLDEELQDIVREGSVHARDAARDFIGGEEEAALERAEDEFEVVTYPDLEPFQEVVLPVYDEVADVMGEEIIQSMQDFLDDYRGE
ncbi:TRAP transporter substrate-binding protein [Salisediminibacterium beveridgei]|uniref:TRAP-type transport system, periplasmic component, predicted N-acetylneuraminate-binding protein n=1 Tax=Salisediminibacterium beveridgei TaxID=632773 RepID=A0A1D7QS08_9BACI|nr:TRAP transporter substrate-binding protein [Salisediminibacterium beveridgei]AOM81779.1 TRAP-type transport system, periplasmic component, predicted N-acetylneuraminate-binding protein [Salisediminibacterium beveridgei]